MDKKNSRIFIGIACVILFVASYFLFNYRNEYLKNEKSQKKEIQHSNDSIINTAFNPEMSSIIKDFMRGVNQRDTIQSTTQNRLKDKVFFGFFTIEGQQPFFYLSVDSIMNKKLQQGYMYFNNDLFVYYGNPDSISQNLIKVDKLETFSFFENKKLDDTKIIDIKGHYVHKYKVENGNKLTLDFEGINK